MPCSGPPFPLVTPDVRISRIRRSQILLAAGVRKEVTAHRHRLQTQGEQVTIPGGAFRGTEGPLAPPAQVPDQTLTHVPADLPKRPLRIAQLEVGPPALQVSVQLEHEPADRLATHDRPGHLPQ